MNDVPTTYKLEPYNNSDKQWVIRGPGGRIANDYVHKDYQQAVKHCYLLNVLFGERSNEYVSGPSK